MINIDDAPWIRDAELNGMPAIEDFKCPICGAITPDELYIDGSSVIGCCECIKRVDAYEWVSEHGCE